MSNLEGVKAAFSRWMGRLDADASTHVDQPTTVTVKLAPGVQPEVEAAHADGSTEQKPQQEGAKEQYGTPVPAEGVVPFGQSGLQGRQWADKPDTPGAEERSALLEKARESDPNSSSLDKAPEAAAASAPSPETVDNGPGQPEGINANVVSDGGDTATGAPAETAAADDDLFEDQAQAKAGPTA